MPIPSGIPDFNHLIPFVFSTAAEALDAALKIIDNDGIAWKIEGPERGVMHMDRNAIKGEYRKRTGTFRG